METICNINKIIETDDLKIEDFPANMFPYKPIGCYEDGTTKDDENYHVSATRLFQAVVNQECILVSFNTNVPVSLCTFISLNGQEECVFWYKKPDGMVTSFPWIFLVPQEVRAFFPLDI